MTISANLRLGKLDREYLQSAEVRRLLRCAHAEGLLAELLVSEGVPLPIQARQTEFGLRVVRARASLRTAFMRIWGFALLAQWKSNRFVIGRRGFDSYKGLHAANRDGGTLRIEALTSKPDMGYDIEVVIREVRNAI